MLYSTILYKSDTRVTAPTLCLWLPLEADASEPRTSSYLVSKRKTLFKKTSNPFLANLHHASESQDSELHFPHLSSPAQSPLCYYQTHLPRQNPPLALFPPTYVAKKEKRGKDVCPRPAGRAYDFEGSTVRYSTVLYCTIGDYLGYRRSHPIIETLGKGVSFRAHSSPPHRNMKRWCWLFFSLQPEPFLRCMHGVNEDSESRAQLPAQRRMEH